jgi:cation:H+ antiporter
MIKLLLSNEKVRGRNLIYLEYLITAAIVVILSIKASNYIDLLDKNTNLSGAFLGGIMLSAVTSLPELFTSISATILLGRPGLCMGNILGSDLFNLAALAAISLCFFKGFAKGSVSKSYRRVAVFVLLIYILVALNFTGVLNVMLFRLNLTSILIVIVYALGAKYLAVADDVESDEDALNYYADTSTSLSVRQIGFRFFLTSIGIIVFSIMVTYLTDEISYRLNLGQGMAGALFLGVATSLPELASTISLFKMKNYNIAVGNIVGSNLFNFIILAVVDLISVGNSVYGATDEKIITLLVMGLISMSLFWIMLRFRNKGTQLICALGIVAAYIGFLM